MFAASVIGALLGVYYLTSYRPLVHYGEFAVLFALLGVAIGNVALMVMVRVYDWLKVEENKTRTVAVEEKSEPSPSPEVTPAI